MKIGQVAAKYGISVDTINYYIGYGLLVPPKKGGQRHFDTQTLRDLERILELKSLEFTLGEIHRILSLYRVSGLAGRQDIADLKGFYQAKRLACMEQRERLAQVVDQLEQKIAGLSAMQQAAGSQIGLPLRMLDLLCCPGCGGQLDISGARMNQRYIFSGECACACGYRAAIENGILLTPNKNRDIHDKPDVNRDMYKDLPPHLITLYQHSYNWMRKRLEELPLSGGVVLETYVNAWFFLHNHQQYLHPGGRYIVVDKYPETLAMYKELIEQQGHGLDILYIADASTALPLRPRSVDVNIDFFAVNEHNFYHNTFLLGELAPYLKMDAVLLGTYFHFRESPRSMQALLAEYPTCSRENFSLPYFNRSMARSGMRLLQQEDVGHTTSTGSNIGFSFHVEGEPMYLTPYLAAFSETEP